MGMGLAGSGSGYGCGLSNLPDLNFFSIQSKLRKIFVGFKNGKARVDQIKVLIQLDLPLR
jgi:hypothetical protein